MSIFSGMYAPMGKLSCQHAKTGKIHEQEFYSDVNTKTIVSLRSQLDHVALLVGAKPVNVQCTSIGPPPLRISSFTPV